jgi:quercetin dioxygenase-like cupin family protein
MPAKTIKTVPYISTFLLENRRVKEYEFFLKPGERTEMHSHPDYIVYVLCDCRLRISMADGKTEDVDFKAGQSSYKQVQTHSIENIGKTDARALIIELKY